MILGHQRQCSRLNGLKVHEIVTQVCHRGPDTMSAHDYRSEMTDGHAERKEKSAVMRNPR